MSLNGVTSLDLNSKCDFLADDWRIDSFKKMEPGVSVLLCIGHAPGISSAHEFTGITDLSPHFGISRGGIENDRGLVFMRYHFQNFGFRGELIIPDKLSRLSRFNFRKRNHRLLLRCPGQSALGFHVSFKSSNIHTQPTFPSHQFCEIKWKSLFVIKVKSQLSRQDKNFFLKYSANLTLIRIAAYEYR